MEKYKYNNFSNCRATPTQKVDSHFENKIISTIPTKKDSSFEGKVSQIISKLRKGEKEASFEKGSIDEAINSLARFVSLMGDSLNKYQEDIRFDTDMSDSIEVTFKGHGITRFNLMFTELNSYEEAFLFYMKDGRPTQINGSLPLMVDLLKQVLR